MNLTQKISQMTPKGSNLAATDLIEVSTIDGGSYVTRSITGQELIDAIPPTTINWGDIGGTLSAQTDLQNALDAKVPTTRTLTINGTAYDLSADRSWTIATGLTIGSTAIASGTIGRVLFQGAGNVLQQSSSLFWDNTNSRLGIGTSSPATPLVVRGSGSTTGILSIVHANDTSNYGARVQLYDKQSGEPVVDGANGFTLIYTNATKSSYVYNYDDGPIIFGTNNSERFRVANTGNVLINTTTDAGFKLDVNGTARVQGNATVSTNLSIGTTLTPNKLTLYGDAINIKRNGANLNVGLLISDDTKNWQIIANRVTNSLNIYDDTLGANRLIISSAGNVLINTTTDAGFRLDVNGTARVQGTLTVLGNGTIFNSTNGTFFHSASGGFSTIDYFNGFIIQNAGQVVFKTAYNGNSRFLRDSIFGTDGANNASAQVQVDSTTKGFLPPRMTNAQMVSIATPAAGLQVYDTTNNKMCVYDGTTWQNLF